MIFCLGVSLRLPVCLFHWVAWILLLHWWWINTLLITVICVDVTVIEGEQPVGHTQLVGQLHHLLHLQPWLSYRTSPYAAVRSTQLLSPPRGPAVPAAHRRTSLSQSPSKRRPRRPGPPSCWSGLSQSCCRGRKIETGIQSVWVSWGVTSKNGKVANSCSTSVELTEITLAPANRRYGDWSSTGMVLNSLS